MKKYRTTPLSDELDDFDYRQSITSIDVPVFFISGEYDYNCPWKLVREYCDVINAPQKDSIRSAELHTVLCGRILKRQRKH